MTSTRQDIFFRNTLALGVCGGLVVAALYWAPAAPRNPFKIADEAVQLEENVNTLVRQQRALEMKCGQKISELIEQNQSDRQNIQKVLARNGAISSEFANLTRRLQDEILPKWKQYEQEAKALRSSWPATLDITPLDHIINFIHARRAETEKRVKTLGEPPPKEANALNYPQGTGPLLCYTQ
jgi:regulator of replication initiation timing